MTDMRRSPATSFLRTLADGLAGLGIDGERVLVVVPDATRSIPLRELFATVHDVFAGRAAAVNILVALGTRQPMPPGPAGGEGSASGGPLSWQLPTRT